MFCDFFMTFLSLKNDVNELSKRNDHKYLERKIIFKVTDEKSRIRRRIR